MLHPFQGRNRYDFRWNQSSSRTTSSLRADRRCTFRLEDWAQDVSWQVCLLSFSGECWETRSFQGNSWMLVGSSWCMLGLPKISPAYVSVHIHAYPYISYHHISEIRYCDNILCIYTASPDWNMLSRVIMVFYLLLLNVGELVVVDFRFEAIRCRKALDRVAALWDRNKGVSWLWIFRRWNFESWWTPEIDSMVQHYLMLMIIHDSSWFI